MARYDMLVIGSGPGGQKAAIQELKSARRSASSNERNSSAGICINSGTIPSKSLREAVLFLSG
jgi:NAD(P) transhydrogenase